MRPIVIQTEYSVVCLSDTVVSRAKTAEPIDMPCGLYARVGSGNHIIIIIIPGIFKMV